jgi:hypothetical protein
VVITFGGKFEVRSGERFANVFSECGDSPDGGLATIGCSDQATVLKRVARAGKRVVVGVRWTLLLFHAANK